nr:hypothetical protein [Clostridia bacterium]
MKKTLSLLLALLMLVSCVLAMVSCRKSAIYELAANSAPTVIVTAVDYIDADGTQLIGDYTMSIEGDNSIFEFLYQRYRLPEDGVADDTYEMIKEKKGTIYYKDGAYSTDGDEYEAEAPTAIQLRFNLDKDYLKDISISENDTVLTAKISPENAKHVLGTDLKAAGDISITVKTNGVNLTMVFVECVAVNGATVSVRTSYSYNSVNLEFPDELEAE